MIMTAKKIKASIESSFYYQKSPKLGLFYPKTCEIAIARRTPKKLPHARTFQKPLHTHIAHLRTCVHVCVCKFGRRYLGEAHILLQTFTQVS